MALKTKVSSGGGGDFERCPVGNHPAVCVAVLGAGTRTEQFQGDPAKDVSKLVLVWEAEADGEDGQSKRYFIPKEYTISLNEKAALRKLLEGWFPQRKLNEGEEVDLARLAGQPCLLTVVDKNGYPRVDSARPLVKGMTPLAANVKTLVWDVDGGTPPPKDAWLPYVWGKPMADYLRECHELGGKGAGQPAGAGAASDAETF